jgi:integrase
MHISPDEDSLMQVKVWRGRRERGKTPGTEEEVPQSSLSTNSCHAEKSRKTETHFSERIGIYNKEYSALPQLLDSPWPLLFVSLLKMLRVNNTRIRFLDEEEEERLLAESKGYLHDIIMTALHTGFRRNELLTLCPDDVDFARRLNQTTRDWHIRVVPLSERKGLSERFFAPLRMTHPRGRYVKCTNVLGFDLVRVRAGYAKNGEARSAPMSTVLHDILLRPVREAKASGSSVLFRNHQGGPLGAYALHDSFENVFKRKAIQALERQFPENSSINFHNTSYSSPLSEAKKAV